MSLINSLENKLGRFAIPGIVGIIAGFQALVWLLSRSNPEFLTWLTLNKTMLLRGEVWRLVTFLTVPSQSHPLWLLCVIFLQFTISRTLDQAWGAFRVNVYVLVGIFFSAAGVLLQGSTVGDLVRVSGMDRVLDRQTLDQIIRVGDGGLMCSYWFSLGIFFAFACVVPNYEIALFGILPLKTVYIALLGAASLLLDFIDVKEARIPMVFTLMNFFVFFTPAFLKYLKHRGGVRQRRARFESAQQPGGSFFHQCADCKKTELDDAKLEFRVTADGEEYCTVCRPKK